MLFDPDDLKMSNVERIRKWGHRFYVGGSDPEMWYSIGRRQYHFLVSRGLRAQHRFLDIACGSLRLGQYLIPMLDNGNYFGIDGEIELIKCGIDNEILFDIVEHKKPVFCVNYDFDFSFAESFDYAIAQSLFTHLTQADIMRCMERLKIVARPQSRFFFTFLEGNEARNPTGPSHPNKGWFYRFATLEGVAQEAGWRLEYIGDWGHERGQMMVLAQPA